MTEDRDKALLELMEQAIKMDEDRLKVLIEFLKGFH